MTTSSVVVPLPPVPGSVEVEVVVPLPPPVPGSVLVLVAVPLPPVPGSVEVEVVVPLPPVPGSVVVLVVVPFPPVPGSVLVLVVVPLPPVPGSVLVLVVVPFPPVPGSVEVEVVVPLPFPPVPGSVLVLVVVPFPPVPGSVLVLVVVPLLEPASVGKPITISVVVDVVFPATSVAVQITEVVPTPNTTVASGLGTGVTSPSIASTASGASTGSVASVPVAVKTWGETTPEKTGAVLSLTVTTGNVTTTLVVVDILFPATSIAVQVIVVVPASKMKSAALFGTAVISGSVSSVAVGATTGRVASVPVAVNVCIRTFAGIVSNTGAVVSVASFVPPTESVFFCYNNLLLTNMRASWSCHLQ